MDTSCQRYNSGRNLTPKQYDAVFKWISECDPQNAVEERNLKVIKLAFLEDMNAAQIERLNDPDIIVYRRGIPKGHMGTRGIQNIISSTFPDIKARNGKLSDAKKVRKELHEQGWAKDRPKVCAVCGSTERVDLHHMVPIEEGGDNSRVNIICLCRSCHLAWHRYRERIILGGKDNA